MLGALLMRVGARRGWRAFNRGDLAMFDRYVADDIVYDVQGDPPFGGRFVGKAEWMAANRRWMDAVEWFKVRVLHEALTHPFALGLTNTVITEYELVARSRDGRTFRTRCIDVSEMRRGKLVAERNYTFDMAAADAFLQATVRDPAEVAVEPPEVPVEPPEVPVEPPPRRVSSDIEQQSLDGAARGRKVPVSG